MIFNKPININVMTNERFIEIFTQYKRDINWCVKKGKKRCDDLYYLNKAISFDTETTSIIDGETKKSWCYIWQMCFDGYVFYSRYLDEFVDFINAVCQFICKDEQHTIMIYVHNLSFDFQFIRKYFNFSKVFALKSRTPIYAKTTNIEFRCSYILTNKPLFKLADDVNETGLKKLIGELNYKTIRTPLTPLTNAELEYCFNDVRLLAAYINKQIAIEGTITNIPLTSTGYVRRFCRDKMSKSEMSFIHGLTIEHDEYKDLLQCFAGGFTHSNPLNTNKVCCDVSSFDFTSSYPYCMLSETFPMSKGKKVRVSLEQLPEMLEHYHLILKCCFTDLISRNDYEFYLSQSKALSITGELVANGRIVSADYCEYLLTDIDFRIVINNYDFSNIGIEYCWVYEKDYLPKSLIESVIKFYRDKTMLKGVKDREMEYMNGKAMLNSIYGMCVTNPLQDLIEYDDQCWGVGVHDKSDLDTYNNDKKRFIFYPWGVWVTAYARRNLWTGINEFKHDYVYSDTDSVKVMNASNHKQYIDEYNMITELKLQTMCNVKGIDYNQLQPTTIDGKLKPLGVWDYEGTYKSFKTLGAKRYMYQTSDNKYHFTISGLPKKGCEFIGNQQKPLEYFSDGMNVPKDETGKLVHTYIDDEQVIDVKDYNGKRCIMKVLSSCHLWETDFTMTLSSDYKSYLAGIKGV